MRNFTFLILFLLPTISLLAQEKFTVSGSVVDSIGSPLSGATVVTLNAADSVLVKFALSGNDGRYIMRRIPVGDYVLQVTFIGYQKLIKPFKIENGDVDLGELTLHSADLTLGEVTIEGERVPIMIKGDTVEYNADAFKTQPNSVVEDLLRKLPGVEVDRNGDVKAQGETVQKVLVEGKEFFGDDPKMATKNLPADAVDKVQVFDKKSEMAEFSGIDDGERQKTINLKLKDDKKQGYFGNISGGYGTDNRFEGRANINRFNKRLQLSAIGMMNNINEQGFSINEYIRFMGGLQSMASGSDGGSMRLALNSSELGIPLGNDLSTGFTNTGAGGLNLNYDLSKKTELNASYFHSNIKNEVYREALRQNFLGGETYLSESINDMMNRNANHRVNFTLRHEIDSFQNLIVRANAGLNNARSRSNGTSDTFSPEGFKENDGVRENNSNGENLSFNSNLIYRRRFRKKGRTISANLSFGNRDDTKNAFLSSLNRFSLNDPVNSFTDSLLQNRGLNNEQINYGLRVAYTEPLGKKRYLGFNLSHQNYTNDVDQTVYDLFPLASQREKFNSLLSNQYQRGYIYNRGGVDLKINRKKTNLTVGVNVQESILNGDIQTTGENIRQSFFAVLPVLRFTYNMTTSQSLDFDYETRLREPSVDQLQPIIDNSDPLNIVVGNPDLRPEYAHSANLHLMSFNQFSFTNFFANFRATYTENKITNSQRIDSLFRQTIKPVNVANDFRLNSYINFGTPLRFIKSRISINLSPVYNRGILFINETENTFDRLISSAGITIENRKKDVVDIAVGTNLRHNITRYSVNKDLNNDFLNQEYFIDLTLNIAKSWTVSSSFDYSIYSGEAFAETEKIPIWKASVSKFVLKNKRGQIKLAAVDLLNRNVGFNRITRANFIEEERIRSLGRYVMLSFTYSLTKLGAEQQGGVWIRQGRR